MHVFSHNTAFNTAQRRQQSDYSQLINYRCYSHSMPTVRDRSRVQQPLRVVSLDIKVAFNSVNRML